MTHFPCKYSNMWEDTFRTSFSVSPDHKSHVTVFEFASTCIKIIWSKRRNVVIYYIINIVIVELHPKSFSHGISGIITCFNICITKNRSLSIQWSTEFGLPSWLLGVSKMLWKMLERDIIKWENQIKTKSCYSFWYTSIYP